MKLLRKCKKDTSESAGGNTADEVLKEEKKEKDDVKEGEVVE